MPAGASRTGKEARFVIQVHKATNGSDYCLSRGSANWERRLAAAVALFLMANLGTHLALFSTQLSTTFSANFRSHVLSPYVV